MTEIAFYHLQSWPLEKVLPRLLEKSVGAGKRVVVIAGSTERVESLNTLLWTYDQDGWLPHGSAKEGDAALQPIWLTADDENPNGASYLFLTDGAASARISDYERAFEIFDGNDSGAVEAARARWRTYQAAGHALAYWQQTPAGSWEKKA